MSFTDLAELYREPAPKKPTGPRPQQVDGEGLSTGDVIGGATRAMFGAAAQEGLIEMPQGAWNLGVAGPLNLAAAFFSGKEQPVGQFQANIDLRKSFLSDEERAEIDHGSNDPERFAFGVAENIGGVLGFLWGMPSRVMGKAGRMALTPGAAIEKMAVKKLNRDGLKRAVIEASEKGMAGKLTTKELEYLNKAAAAERSGDVLNAWENLALGKLAPDAGRVGAQLKKWKLGRFSPDGQYVPGFSVRAAQEMQGFAAMELIRSPRDPETGEILPGVNLDARLGAAFSAFALAPIYTAVGSAAGILGGKMVEKGMNNRAANVAKGALEGLGFSAFEIGLLVDGIGAAIDGDYEKLLEWAEHAAGSTLGFAFAHGVAPRNLKMHRRNAPEDYMPTDAFLGKAKEMGLTDHQIQKMHLAGIDVAADGNSLRPPRGTDKWINLRENPSTGESEFIRMDRKGRLHTTKGEDVEAAVDRALDRYLLSALESRKLDGLGFAETPWSGVYVSPNADYYTRIDHNGNMLEQAIGVRKNAAWKPTPKMSAENFAKRYGVKEGAEPQTAGWEPQPNKAETWQSLKAARELVKPIITYAINAKLLKGEVDSFDRRIWEAILFDADTGYRVVNHRAADELAGALGSHEVQAALHQAVREGNVDALKHIARALGHVAVGEVSADVAAKIAEGSVVFGPGTVELLRSERRSEEIREMVERGEDLPGEPAKPKILVETKEVTLPGRELNEIERAHQAELQTERRKINERLVDLQQKRHEAEATSDIREGEHFLDPEIKGMQSRLRRTERKLKKFEDVQKDKTVEVKVDSPLTKNPSMADVVIKFSGKEGPIEISKVAENLQTQKDKIGREAVEKEQVERETALDEMDPVKRRTVAELLREDAKNLSEALQWHVEPLGFEHSTLLTRIDERSEWATTKPQRSAEEVAYDLRINRERIHQLKNLEASLLRQKIMDKVPDRQDREDMIYYIQGTENPQITGDTPVRLKARMSDSAKAFADKHVRPALDKIWQQMHEIGVFSDDSYRDNYITQVWKPIGKRRWKELSDSEKRAGWKFISKEDPHAKKRRWRTYADGVKKMRDMGFEPKFTQVQDIMRHYQGSLARAEANAFFLDRLKNMVHSDGERMVVRQRPGEEPPPGYEQLGQHPQLKNLWFKPELGKQMKLIFDWSNGSEAWARSLLNSWYSVKGAALRYSFFHLFALGVESASSDRGPLGAMKDWMTFGKDILRGRISEKHKMKLTNPQTGKTVELGTQELLRDAVKHGLVIDTPHEYQKSFLENWIDGWVTSSYRKGGKPVIAEALGKGVKRLFNDWLWDGAFPNLKLQGYAKRVEQLMPHLGRMDKKGRIWTLERIKEQAAEHINDAYGGQNWSRFNNAWFATQRGRQIQQALLLSPDWTISNLRIAGRAVTGKNELSRGMSGQYMMTALGVSFLINAIGGWTSFMMMSEEEQNELREDGINPLDFTHNAVSKKMWEVGLPISGFRLGKDGGRWQYAKTMKQQQEVVRWILNPFEVGGAKLHPLIKTLVRNFSGSDISGYPAPWDSGDGFWSTLGDRTIDLAAQWIPISLSTDARNLLLERDDPANQFAFIFPKGAEMTDWQMKETMVKSIGAYAAGIPLKDETGRKYAGRKLLRRIRDLKKVAARNGVNYSYALRQSTALVQRQLYEELKKALKGQDEDRAARAYSALANIGTKPSTARSNTKELFMELLDEGKARWTYSELRSIVYPEIEKNMRREDYYPMVREAKQWGREWAAEERDRQRRRRELFNAAR